MLSPGARPGSKQESPFALNLHSAPIGKYDRLYHRDSIGSVQRCWPAPHGIHEEPLV